MCLSCAYCNHWQVGYGMSDKQLTSPLPAYVGASANIPPLCVWSLNLGKLHMTGRIEHPKGPRICAYIPYPVSLKPEASATTDMGVAAWGAHMRYGSRMLVMTVYMHECF